MKIKIICVGKLKEKYFVNACNEYLKRISPFSRIEIIEVPDVRDDRADCIEIEAKSILKQINKKEYVITLEIGGEQLTSENLAKKISLITLRGISDIVFVIGGSRGLSESVSKIADYKLSFSKMTFPHQLIRVMLLEQIYRAYKINEGGKYHK